MIPQVVMAAGKDFAGGQFSNSRSLFRKWAKYGFFIIFDLNLFF